MQTLDVVLPSPSPSIVEDIQPMPMHGEASDGIEEFSGNIEIARSMDALRIHREDIPTIHYGGWRAVPFIIGKDSFFL